MISRPDQFRSNFEMRVLLAFQEKHGTHMDAVRSAIRERYPRAEVTVTVPRTLEGEMDRLEPHLVVCEPPIFEIPGGKLPVCLELSIDTNRPSRFRVGERRWESLNPGRTELLALVADTTRLIST